jgi:hypothetical protein
VGGSEFGGMTTPCITRAWLTLGALTVALEDQSQGWFMEALDLGYPAVREVVTARPDADGVDDRTQFFGSRAISASVKAVAGAGAAMNAVAASFAPFMVPAARPVLHYILERPGNPERVITVRAAGYAWPLTNPGFRDIQLQWIAADPIARNPVTSSATAYTGAATGAGRAYNLAYNRTYPSGGGSAATATLYSPGDVTVRPVLRIYGPVTAPVVAFSGGNGVAAFGPTLTVSGGQYVEVDCAQRSAYLNGDRTLNVLTQMDWVTMNANGGWPRIPPATSVTMTYTGQSTSGSTQVQASWNDGYLS